MEHMMLLVTYRMLPGQRDAFLQEVAAAGILAKVQQEDGFERYDYYLSAADPDELLIVEEWDSEAQQQASDATSKAERAARDTLAKAQSDANATIEAARSEANRILEDAQRRAQVLVSQEEIVRRARVEASEAKQNMQEELALLRQNTFDYLDGVMEQLDRHLSKTVSDLRLERSELNNHRT